MDDTKKQDIFNENDNLKASDKPEGKENLVYEETPIIEPIQPQKHAEEPDLEQKSKKDLPDPLATPELPEEKMLPVRKKGKSFLTNLFIFGLLFVFGTIISYFIRPFFNPKEKTGTQIENQPQEIDLSDEGTDLYTEKDAASGSGSAASSRKPFTLSNKYNINLSFDLPENIPEPNCDGASCTSMGSYLPGGTRFTVAVNKRSQPVVNFPGSKITDAAGRIFPNINITEIAGKQTLDFSGEFTGRTTGGYTFSRMRGVMILFDPATTVELNHFSPSGINVDFEADDKVFEEIIKSVKI